MLRLIVFALAARGAAAANAEITTGAALEDAIGGERPVLALFCSKTAHMCAEHLLGAFDELVLRRDDVALASLSGPAEPALTKALDVHAYRFECCEPQLAAPTYAFLRGSIAR